MTKTTKRGDALRATFEALPVSVFNSKGSTPAEFLPSVFGANTSVEPMVYCSDMGTWVSGYTVVVALPDGGGCHGFVLRQAGETELMFERMGRGARINLISKSLNGLTWSAEDLSELVAVGTKKVAKGCGENYYYDFERAGVLNSERDVWLLRHLRSLLGPQECGTSEFLMALALEASAQAHVTQMLGAAENVVANQHRVRESEETIVRAVVRHNGVTLHGAQVETLGVAGALMPFPFEAWDVEADRLVKHAYEVQSLDERFHPPRKPDPKKVTPPRSARVQGTSSFAIGA